MANGCTVSRCSTIEVVDLGDPSFTCDRSLPKPQRRSGGLAAIIDNVPILCLGYSGGSTVVSCEKLDYEEWKWKLATPLKEVRGGPQRGTVLYNNKLHLSGGQQNDWTKFVNTELASLNDTTYHFDGPAGLNDGCNIQINDTHILITQVYQTGQTWFQDLTTGKLTEGPVMNEKQRYRHGCTKFQYKGQNMALVAFGYYKPSCEVLNLDNPENGWDIKLVDGSYEGAVTGGLVEPELVTLQNTVYMFGGRNPRLTPQFTNNITKLVCGEETCKFVPHGKMKVDRMGSNVLPITEDSVNKLCSDCPPGWSKFKNRCYWFSGAEKRSYDAAENKCLYSFNAKLAEPKNAEENQALFEFAKEKLTVQERFWIGINDMKEEGK